MTTIEALRIDIEKLSIERYMSLTENEKKTSNQLKLFLLVLTTFILMMTLGNLRLSTKFLFTK